MAKIIITGSNGFIGKRLIHQLLEQNHEVYALIRVKGTKFKTPPSSCLHFIYGDLRDPSNLEPFPEDADAAYYLVHSMGSVVQNLVETETQIARNFVRAVEKTRCKQVIFLGGIIEDETQLSPHLFSRLSVEKVLRTSKVPATILRASIIIGSGSASFEIIRDLVEKLPVMVAPRWVKSYCQPIGIRDVLFYLTGVLLKPSFFNQVYDIGGPEVMTFEEALLRFAKFRKLKRFIVNVPVLTPRLSSYWLVLITSVKFSICSYLVESMRHDTRKLNRKIDEDLPHLCISYEDAIQLAFQKIAQNEIVSTWMDAWDIEKIHGDLQNYLEVPEEGCLKDIQIIPLIIPFEEAKQKIWRIGGEKGWYSLNWAWSIRGMIDKLLGGTGLNRGRRHPTAIQVGDSIDFWRVLLADEKRGHLILYAEMKIPGEAWLEFELDRSTGVLKQVATFRPQGIWGRCYWYLLLPFHWIIFRNMAKAIAGR